MKALIILFFLLMNQSSFSQDTNATWIKNIHEPRYQIHYDKRIIPKEFYAVLRIDDIKALANQIYLTPKQRCFIGVALMS
jgi:hypothetical protein